ncbi:MAG: helix-turn-helix domain-containing protein [Planctomycetes bacterium]|nr:helix-turn-helix domain-containing protein [Planctomycetota bacterium]MCC7399613.1 helix-turn-helix domain-containing protein [Planctomycetota bacterium]
MTSAAPRAPSASPVDLLTPAEAAEHVRLRPRTIRKWVGTGRLAAYRTQPGRGGRILVRLADVLAQFGICDTNTDGGED